MLTDKMMALAAWVVGASTLALAGNALLVKFQLALEHYAAVARSVMGWMQ